MIVEYHSFCPLRAVSCFPPFPREGARESSFHPIGKDIFNMISRWVYCRCRDVLRTSLTKSLQFRISLALRPFEMFANDKPHFYNYVFILPIKGSFVLPSLPKGGSEGEFVPPNRQRHIQYYKQMSLLQVL